MYRIPALETVAGVANLRSLISNNIFIQFLSTILPLLARVSSLLSSITEFILSIQLASKSPSRMIHLGYPSVKSSEKSYMKWLRSPFFHSFVFILVYPYKSLVLTTLGSISWQRVFCPFFSLAFAKSFQVVVFPEAGGPIKKTQCLISRSSFN